MMKTSMLAAFVVLACSLVISVAFQSSSWSYASQNRKQLRVKPLNENFFLDVGEDPSVNTPKQIFGEVAYKSFVEKYDPDALLIGGPKYDILGRVRELKLLSQTADSGLLELLEEKGLTLSQAEKLLPLADSLNLLPLLLNNKNLLLSAAPLLIEPAPALLPVVVGVLKTPPQNYVIPAVLLLGTGLYEVLTDNVLLGGAEVLLGLPLLVLGTVLSGKINVPTAAVSVLDDEPKVASSRRPTAGKKVVAAPPPKPFVSAARRTTAAPTLSSGPRATSKTSVASVKANVKVLKAAPKIILKVPSLFASEPINGRRKVVKVN